MRAQSIITIICVTTVTLIAICIAVLTATHMRRNKPDVNGLPSYDANILPPDSGPTTVVEAPPALSAITVIEAPLLPSSTTVSEIPPPQSSTTVIAPPTPSKPAAPKPFTFHIEISNQRQHVGSWYGDYIRDDIKSVLKDKCSEEKTGTNTCSTDEYTFDNIEHSNSRRKVETTKNVVINVATDTIPEAYGKSLQAAFIEQIADTYMIASTDDKNCYKFDRKSTICSTDALCFPPKASPPDNRGRVIKWCNAPEYVRVIIDNSEGSEVAHMKVNLKFQGDTDQGKFDCVGVINAVGKNARENGQSRLMEATGGRDFETVVACSSKEVTGSCPTDECLYQLGSCFK